MDTPWVALPKRIQVSQGLCYDEFQLTGTDFWLPGMRIAIYGSSSPLSVSKKGGGLVIDWNFPDALIVAELKKWLREKRPKGTVASTRGHKFSDPRAALDMLGSMRLLHHATPKQLETSDPVAWKWLSRRSYFRDRTKAKLNYLRLFPILGDFCGIEPRSWISAGGRSKVTSNR